LGKLEAEKKEVEDAKSGSLVCVADKLKEDLKQVEREVKTATIQPNRMAIKET
jgi:hypothetical protein